MDEDMQNDTLEERIQKLGFKPQKEIIYTKVLPYADQLDTESARLLADIKSHLGKAVMMREMKPGCGTWSARLYKYIKMFGLKFSKEDHLIFIHLMFELVTIPNLEPWLTSKFANVLIALLKKKELISPTELTLPWRPLYELFKRITSSSGGALGMYRYFTNLEGTLDTLVAAAKVYFPETATAEMLAEWRPLLCPFDQTTMCETVEWLESFLPVSLLPHQAHLGYELWFHELTSIWEACHNAPQWEGDMMWLMARLASNNIGYIDWEPYLPLMFTRFQRSLNLPVAYKQVHASKHHKLETSPMALWIVSVLGGGSSCQKYLDKFLNSLDSYFHPANYGRWFMKLKELLRKLPIYFTQRLHVERYKKLSWQTQIPASKKLTEEDITCFVESIKPVALQAMFSKLGCVEVSQAMQHLATLRPKVIIPSIVDRMYSNLETLTEPHKLTAAMQCLTAVARPMVNGFWSGYREGPTHVIPFLTAVLPGIDPNDIRKCFVTFQFISTITSLIPVVDASSAPQYWPDLSEEEATVCRATINLEDFVLQFMDRCFTLIESSSLEVTRLERDADKRSKLENLAEGAIASTCTALLMQTSPDIFKSALRKLQTFVTSHILETKVSGHFLATMIHSFSKVNAEETLRLLLPYFTNNILLLTESDDVLTEELLDNELLYNMLLLSRLAECQGCHLLPHVRTIWPVLDRILKLTSREGIYLATCVLRCMLSSMSSVIPREYRSTPMPFDRPCSEYLCLKDWGKPGNIHKLQLDWQVPGMEEVACVQEMIIKYLTPELERIDNFSADKISLTRNELLQSLYIVNAMLGCRTLLPIWDEPPISLMDSSVGPKAFSVFIKYGGTVTMPDGTNVRKIVVDVMHRLQMKLLSSQEDDTKSFFALIQILENLLLNRAGPKNGFETHMKSFRMVKKVLENKLIGGKQHLRALLVDRAALQHEQINEMSAESITQTHADLMIDLLQLSQSHYSEVRIRAQGKLFAALEKFSFSYTIIVPHLLQSLQKDSNKFHEQFKGALYVLLGPKQSPLITRHDWSLLNLLWPAIVRAKPSEKLSVIRLLDTLSESVHKHFPTITIDLEVPDSCVHRACKLWDSLPAPSLPPVEESDVALGLQRLKQTNEDNHAQYLNVLNSLMDVVDQHNLHWRFNLMTMGFLRDLVHPDLIYPARIVRCFLHTLIHDSLELRKIALRGVVFSLKQQKRKHTTRMVDPLSLSGTKYIEMVHAQPGDRPDNRWLQYNSSRRILSVEQWDSWPYLHKPYHGYYVWPKEVQVYAPSSEQPPLDRDLASLSAEEREVYEFFSNGENIARLIAFFSLEEKKGKDKFNGLRFIMFKGLFRNHGNTHLPLFLPHLERLVQDKQESSQRCAAELIAGLIRGSKHWPFNKVEAMWQSLIPLIKTALINMTVETVGDWGVCFATASECRDPNRHHWLLELLMEDPLRNEASFIECGRMYTLQGAVNQQQWRLQELFHRLLVYFKPFLTHPFQNVRERLASMLVNIFETDLVIGQGSCSGSPPIANFVAEVVPRLNILYQAGPKAIDVVPPVQDSLSGKAGVTMNETVNETTKMMSKVEVGGDDKDVAIRLLKTVCRWVTGSIGRVHYGARPEFYALLPVTCSMESYEGDEELSKTCTAMLASLSQVLILPQHIPIALATLTSVSECSSWTARATCLEFLQVLVFHNMPTILSQQAWTEQVTNLVLRLLEDDWLDVQEKAAQALGGLVHCDFFPSKLDLLENFKTKAKTKLRKRQNGLVADTASIETAKIRHSGVLGLCAFVNAYPYDVPEFVPDVFLILGAHLNDPQPIPSTIRKTLGNFKRTHHDDWAKHSLKFTEEQLAVLGDLIIPPSYCA